MRGIFYLLVSSLVIVVSMAHAEREPSFVVVIPSYNNIDWYQRNLAMLCAQEQHYSSWRAIYIDDGSTDGTAAAVADYLEQQGFSHKVSLIKNEQRRGALANLYHAIHSCHDHEIVVNCDGDDWFYDEQVLAFLATVYRDEQVWMTYGQYQEYPSGDGGMCRPFPDWVTERNAYRDYDWVSSHLRTYYAWLFKRIVRADLCWQQDFFPMTWDLAMMFPMLEMAGEHARCIQQLLYVYNIQNPLNDFKKDLNFMYQLNRYIRQMPRYARLSSLSE